MSQKQTIQQGSLLLQEPQPRSSVREATRFFFLHPSLLFCFYFWHARPPTAVRGVVSLQEMILRSAECPHLIFFGNSSIVEKKKLLIDSTCQFLDFIFSVSSVLRDGIEIKAVES